MNPISSWEEVPLFDREESEAAFWADNRIDVRLMESAVTTTGSELADSITITLRIDPRMLARIKRLARSRYLNYQSMIKQWLSERMEQEMREQKMERVRPMDNPITMNTKATMFDGARLAFTLIELLTVIAIMAIVAALVVTMGQAASQKKKDLAVEAGKNKLVTMISSYQAKLNYYPPDNGLLAANAANLARYEGYAATNPLIYELFGCTNTNNGANLIVFNSSAAAPNILSSTYSSVFNRGGIANGDATEPQNFFQPGPLPKEYARYAAGNGSSPPICGLIVPAELIPGNTNNFWHYDSSSANRHNMSSFDLWAEYSVGSKGGVLTIKTNGNW